MSKGGKTVTDNKSDPQVVAAAMGNLDSAKALGASYHPFEGDLTAGTNPALTDYFARVQAMGDTGKPALASAQGAAASALGYQPMHITAPTAAATSAGQAATYDPSGMIAALHTAQAGASNRGDVRDVSLMGFNADSLAPFLNPATDALVTSRLKDNEHAREIQANHDASRFSSGSWGGSRQGVNDAVTNEAFQRTGDAAAADARSKAFDAAVSAWMGTRGQDLSAAQGNQSADLNVLDQNAETGRFNAGETNTAGRAGLGILADAARYNTGAANDRAEADAGRTQQTSLANQAAALAAATSNQGADATGADIRLRGASTLGDLSNSEVSQATSLAHTMGDAATQQQTLSQSEKDRQYAAWLQDFQNRIALQGQQTGAVGALPNSTTQTQTTSGGGLGGILGGVGTLLQGAAAFSDIRLKRDVKTVGYDDGGRRWVDFAYLWDEPGEVRRGVIAQEIRATMPAAVIEHASGYLMVDYAQLGG